MDERAFLDRLRARAPRSQDRALPELAPLPPAGLSELAESVRQNGMQFHETTRAALTATVAGLFDGPLRFAAWRTPLLEPIVASLREAGWSEVVPPAPPADSRPVLQQIEAGFVEAEVVVAETGSVGLVSGPGRGLLVALFARTLVVAMPESALLPGFDDLPGWLAEHPVNLSLISGPSRTGDVAQKHILGAHGPAVVHVVYVRG